MKLFTNGERDILKKFKKGKGVSEADADILNRYASVGFVQFGFNWDTMNKTAKLTNSGMKHLNR